MSDETHRAQTTPRYNQELLIVPGGVLIEQTTGIEPASSAWEADILPMYYVCKIRAYDSSQVTLTIIQRKKKIARVFLKIKIC